MLLRFVLKNTYSFKDQTEFNLFPSSKSGRHFHHIVTCNDVNTLRFSAIYGANGAGKSNLIKAIANFKAIILNGGVTGIYVQQYKFQFSQNSLDEPVSMAIEFFHNGIIYYYTFEFDRDLVSYEYLAISEKDKDKLVFERKTNGTQSISFGPEYDADQKNSLFSSVLQDKLLNKGSLLLSFMAINYPDEIPGIKDVYSWIKDKLLIVKPSDMYGTAAQMLDMNPEIKALADKLLPKFGTGITGLRVRKTVLEESQLGESAKTITQALKANPGQVLWIPNAADSRIAASLVYENGQLVQKELQPSHSREDGSSVDLPLQFESDGSLRLIDYIPLIYLVMKDEYTIIIDEIERSLHPILVKELMSWISENEKTMGQLVFTTHESCLLDQQIFRPDEIWFTEKDSTGTSHMYPLSDFNIHRTASIEHGYLIGRYGGIPFLSNLKDLNW